MKKWVAGLVGLIALVLVSTGTWAIELTRFEYGFNIDGTVYNDTLAIPSTSNTFDASGLGTFTWQTSAAGSHSFIAYFDFEIDETVNTYFNEFGAANGAPLAGQSWEIDEPSYSFGDIYWNFEDGTLDNSNGVPESLGGEDVSFALGWDFSLLAGEKATINIFLAETAPSTGFYLSHTDPDSQYSIFLFSELTTGGGGGGDFIIPEPGTVFLLGTGLIGLLGWSWRRKHRN